MTTRTAIISPSTASVHVVNAYLPANYRAVPTDTGAILIIGQDRAGWTLDGYVIPRLASGLYFAKETAVDSYIGTDGVAHLARPGETHSKAWHAALGA